MRLCRAFNIAACLLPLGLSAIASGVANAQAAWPAPPPSQQQPAGAWPAPASQSVEPAQAPSGGWPAPGAAQPAPSGAWPAPGAGQAPPQQGFAPPPSQGFQPSIGLRQQQPQQEPPCFKDFMVLRTDADKKGKAIQAAGKKKVPPAVACRLFNEFSASEGKMVKFVSTNFEKCQIPKEVVENMTKNHAKTNEIRTRVCEVAAAPPKPRGPSLSDALNAPVPDSSNVKTGRGTFDTLSGSALGK
ncbi:MAG: hypothetical protein WC670_13870 [Pseudolabrys sp.]|jgi:hypothetical protein